MTAHPIQEWHVCISGFLQDEGRPTGISRAWRSLHNARTRPDARVELRSWNDDFKALAEFIWRFRDEYCDPTINLYGYSWGGAGAVRLAEELHRRGLRVDHMVLCDPVYRHPYWLGNWRAFWPWSTIVIPENVREVTWFRQSLSLPKGHDLMAQSPRTILHQPVELSADHLHIDEEPAFFDACFTASDIPF